MGPVEYRELIFSLTSAWKLAATNIKKAQAYYKQQYGHHATSGGYNIGDLVLVKFPRHVKKVVGVGSFHVPGMNHTRLTNIMTLI